MHICLAGSCAVYNMDNRQHRKQNAKLHPSSVHQTLLALHV